MKFNPREKSEKSIGRNSSEILDLSLLLTRLDLPADPERTWVEMYWFNNCPATDLGLIQRVSGNTMRLLINGHHRRKVLAQLKMATASCVVWDLDDAEALLLLATINRLSGRDDLSKRAKLLAQLQEYIGDRKLLKAFPETRERLDKVLALNRPPAIVDPKSLTMPLEAMTFFVTESQKVTINSALAMMRQRDKSLNRAE